jgi:hypothetical protein
MGNAVYEILGISFGKTRTTQTLIIVAGLLLIGIVVLLLKAVAKLILSRRVSTGGSEAFNVQRRALIFTVGKQSDTIQLCIQHQGPQFVGFICSRDSEAYADALVSSLGLDPDACRKRMVNPWNIDEIRENALQLLSWVKEKSVQAEDIAFDVTGGLTTMSVGVFMVAEESCIDTQYVRSEYDDNGKRLPKTEEAVFIRRYSNTSPTLSYRELASVKEVGQSDLSGA